MTQTEWLELGIARGWCTPVVCQTHDGPALTEFETWQFDEGDDPCVPVVRLWETT